MEIRQLRYFVKIIEHGSMGRAATELGTTTSTLSQQVSRLESELSTRLLLRRATGIQPTEAGSTLFKQAQLILRQLDNATNLVQKGRLTGTVSLGLAQSTAAMLSVPFITTMNERYPGIRLRIIEGLSGHLLSLLNTRRIDLAILFDDQEARRRSAHTLLQEELLLISAPGLPGMPEGQQISIEQIAALPLLLPSSAHTLQGLIVDAFRERQVEPNVAAEIDGLSTLLNAVRAGLGASIQPGSAIAGLNITGLVLTRIVPRLVRVSHLASLSDDELSPAALAARVVLSSVARTLVADGKWYGANLYDGHAPRGFTKT
ncbi:MAG: LysR family transcriptional regulator [Pigmentiphaga sp.]|uniref:LysR family transcriptional regulator n=1 Tax=Pigmentiphaga sp. TaxID=1977564 RepID=UPI0029B6B595|nr:LysR family transcriptional regulator [Pigmentiphaga sp.]MDX3906845.1 LysR family transcriptional regulator [Pigmentiphaga sp.]